MNRHKNKRKIKVNDMYNSERVEYVVENPRETKCPNIIEFIKDTCRFYPGCDTITQDAYDAYVRYCNDKSLQYKGFNTFAKAFKYNILHRCMVTNIQYIPVNYMAYKDGVGYVYKKGWSYRNLCVDY